MPIVIANGYGALGAFGAKGPINAVLDVQEIDPVYPYDEPVTLAQVKNYMKVDFNDDDDLISDLLVVAREELEKYCGLSFVPKRWICQLRNDCGGIEIPYGPTPGVIDETLILDFQGNVVDSSWISISGLNFKTIYTPTTWLQLTYDAGYGTTYQNAAGDTITAVLPRGLILAIKAVVFFLYQNRGEFLGESSGVRQYSAQYIADAGEQLCNKYRRNFDLMGF